MDALLARLPVDAATILERIDDWTRVADANRNTPSIEAALRERVGRLLLVAGRPDIAITHLRQSLALRSAASAPSSAPWARCDPATAALGEALLVCGAVLEAEPLLREAIGPLPQPSPGEPPTIQPAPTAVASRCAFLLAELLRSNHRPHEAMAFIESSLAGFTALHGPDADETRLARIQRARVLGSLARVADALDEIEQIHGACSATRGSGDWLTHVAALALGEAETRVGGRVQGGFERLTTTAPALLASLPPTSWHRIDGIARAVELLESRRQWAQSESILRAALLALEADKRPVPPAFVPRARLALARNLVRQQKLQDATPLVEAAAAALRAIDARLPDADDALADALSVAADIARRRKQFPQAHQLCNEAQEIRMRLAAGKSDSPGVALCRVQRGWIMLDEEDFIGAEEELKDAVPLVRERLGEMDWRAGQARLILGEVRYKQVRLEEAEEDIVYGTRIVLGRRGPDEDGLHALRLCVDLYETWGNAEMATHYRRMLPESHSHDEIDTGE